MVTSGRRRPARPTPPRRLCCRPPTSTTLRWLGFLFTPMTLKRLSTPSSLRRSARIQDASGHNLRTEDERPTGSGVQQQHVPAGGLCLLRERSGHCVRHQEDRGAEQDCQRQRRGQSSVLLQEIRGSKDTLGMTTFI